MTALLALMPCVVVVVGVLILRVSGLTAAWLALGCASVIWLFAPFEPASLGHLGRAVADTFVLELLVGSVVFTGLMFVDASTRSGAPLAIRALIEGLDLPPARTAIMVTTGIGIMVESLTGYGVSMLVTLPLLLLSFSRQKAIVLALVGMSLMPWGALSVSALLGAELAGVPVSVLSDALLLTSGPVAVLLPVMCVLVTQGTRTTELPFAVLSGCVLLGGITVTSQWLGVEVAGVGGGFAVLVLCVATGKRSSNAFAAMKRREFSPFAFLLGALLVQKALLFLFSQFSAEVSLATARVSFTPLASPALALLAGAWLTHQQLKQTDPTDVGVLLGRVFGRAWRALLSILVFLLTARLLLEAGAVSALGDWLSGLGRNGAVVTVTALGGLGAYVTGSGVTANALFMPSAAATGQHFDLLTLFAALQHSAAGHAAMASLPVVAVLLAALPKGEAGDEAYALRSGLMLALLWVSMVAASGFAQISLT